MMRVALKGLLGRKLRAFLTGFAIVLGVAMISGSFILTDTLGKSFDGVYDETYKSTDAVISSTQTAQAQDGDTEALSFSAGVLASVRQLPGVGAAQGSIEDDAQLLDKKGELIGSADNGIGVGFDGTADQSMNPLQVADGRWPQRDGEIAIDRATARKQGYEVGQTIGAYTGGPVEKYRITGILTMGSLDTVAGATIAVFNLPTAERLFDKQGKLDLIRVDAADGVSQPELVRQIEPVLSATTQVMTGEEQAAADSAETQEGMSVFKYFLLGFGGIALFVGAFVIANTLAITVAQRMRELATLRTLGASRRQVLGSVVLESVAVGLIGSVTGLFVGLGIAVGLTKLLEATGIALPGGSLVFAPRTVVVSIAVGTFIALLASLRPAIKATRIDPIAAVREGASLPPSRFARFALPVAGLVGAVAIGLFSYGLFASDLEIKVRLAALIVGVLVLFVGVAMVASRTVRPLAWVLGAPGARLGGSAGRLARQNAVRNPSRTASTAAAVMIGITLITFVAVIGQGFRASFTEAVDELFVADYAITAGKAPLTNESSKLVATASGIKALSEIRADEGKVGGKDVAVIGVDGDLTKVVRMTWTHGSDAVPGQLGRDGAFVSQRYADDHALAVGSRLTVTTPTGDDLRLRVKGIWDEPKGGSPLGGVSISLAAFDRAYTDHDNEFTLLNVEGGPADATTARLEQSLSSLPDATVQTRDEFKESRLGSLSMILNVLYVLLGLSVIVSLFGVINTLVLSVFERTRELGMLRAIGMTRRQVRRMVRHESIVTALIGATLGIGLGTFLAALTTAALSDYGIVFAIPYGTLAVFMLVAVAAGTLAAILPARRAARLDPLTALQYE